MMDEKIWTIEEGSWYGQGESNILERIRVDLTWCDHVTPAILTQGKHTIGLDITQMRKLKVILNHIK